MKHVWYIVTRTNPDTGTQEWRCIATESWTAYRCLAHPFGSVEVARCARNKAGDKLARIIKVTWTPKPPKTPKPSKTHDLKWALRMLGRGKRVRGSMWAKHCYLEVTDAGIVGEDGCSAHAYLMLHDSWTLYREPSK